MDQRCRALRDRLRRMAPHRAVAYVEAMGLPSQEAYCVLACDVRGLSCQQAADALHMSADGLHKLRRRVYRKMLDAEDNKTAP